MNNPDTGFLRRFRPRKLTLLPQKQNLTGIFFIDPGQYFHHGGFSGAVLSDQRHHSAGVDPQGGTG